MMNKYNINQTTLNILRLYACDYRRSLHIRAIAREIKVDVKAVQLQLKRLERANILSSLLKGRNKEFSLNLNNLVTKYYMMLAETFASINYLHNNFPIKRILDEIENRVEGTIILFGSFVKGQTTKESDVDLFLIDEETLGWDAIREASNLIGREISIKSATKSEFIGGLEERDPLVMEVVSNHVVLRGIDDFCDIMWRYHARQ